MLVHHGGTFLQTACRMSVATFLSAILAVAANVMAALLLGATPEASAYDDDDDDDDDCSRGDDDGTCSYSDASGVVMIIVWVCLGLCGLWIVWSILKGMFCPDDDPTLTSSSGYSMEKRYISDAKRAEFANCKGKMAKLDDDEEVMRGFFHGVEYEIKSDNPDGDGDIFMYTGKLDDDGERDSHFMSIGALALVDGKSESRSTYIEVESTEGGNGDTYDVLREFALSSDGFDMSPDDARAFAEKNQGKDGYSVSRLKGLKEFAYSSDGMDKTTDAAIQFAIEHANKQYFTAERLKELKEFAYSSDGMDKTTDAAMRFALEHANEQYFTAARLKELKEYAYSSDGLDMSISDAIDYAVKNASRPV